MLLTSMTDELVLLRRRYEYEGLQENVAAVDATLRQLRSHPRRWAVSAATDRKARFRLMSV